MRQKLYILLGTTESGDTVGPYAWTYMPTPKQVRNVFERDWATDLEAGTITNYKVEQIFLENVYAPFNMKYARYAVKEANG